MSNVSEWRSSVTVFGKARGQGSKRAVTLKGSGKAILIDASPDARPWRDQVSRAMSDCAPDCPLDCAVQVTLTHYVTRPQTHYGTGKNAGVLKQNAPAVPKSGVDLDKLQRAVGDAMMAGGWVTDDQRVHHWDAVRLYAEDGRERVDVTAQAAFYAGKRGV